MKFKLIPFLINTQKHDFHVGILGIHWRQRELSIGLSIRRVKEIDRKNWYLLLFFYGKSVRLTIKTTFDEWNFVCNTCGGKVWKHSKFCPTCRDHLDDEDITIRLIYPD